ncbi:MAG: PD-(D/E)XK nuclease family protein [Bacteroidales bacterium]|nr:PD-(D/E)XK nuclease family protein [Bacteroidales bacterium]
MPPFLFQTAQYIHEAFGNNLSEVAIVLPNRRAGLFFRKYLSGMLPGTAWAPALFSIEEFITSVSGLREVEQVHCLIELYKVHENAEGAQAQPFDEFLNWGGQLLSDFNEIDRYLVDPEAIFTYLDEVRVMTVWNPDNQPLTEFQLSYLKFYNSLLSYYTGLTTALLSRGEAYQGLIFRNAWQKMEQGEAEIPWKKVIFVGFNALTTAEEKIIDLLVKRGDGELLWDADSYYLDDPKQEAGDYLRQWFRKWPQWSGRWKSDDFKSDSKEIQVIGAPDLVGQVKLTGTLLQEWKHQKLLNERIAVILPDEQLLLPLLNSLPEGIDAVNITMGLPLSQTPLADLLALVYELHHHAVTMTPGGRTSGRFYFRDVVKVLQHPYVTRLASAYTEGNQFAFRELVEKIKSGKKTFLQRKDLVTEHTGLFGTSLDFLDLLFTPWDSLDGALTGLQVLVEAVVFSVRSTGPSSPDQQDGEAPQIELEYAYAAARILRQLRLLIAESGDFLTWDSLAKFLKQLLDTTMLPFYGEPLKGLQIMGMLETRTLDFDRVIILSCNEGILPSGKNVQSFIPFDVRKDFHLPLHRQKDAIYAYHFYRLLQRASHVWLIYNSEPGQLGGGDPSRFIRQIEAELPGYNPAIAIRNEVLVTPLLSDEPYPPIEIEKGDAVMEKLMAKASSGFSPTTLNAYRTCTLRFYFSEVAGLKEPEEAEGEIDPKTLGSAVHHALMNLFKPFKGSVLTRADVFSMEPLIEAKIDRAFREVFKGDSMTTGQNLLLVEVAKIMVRKFIRGEAMYVEQLAEKGDTLTVDLLEQPLSRLLALSLNGLEVKIRLKGFVDRVDRIGGITRVIDYKTGNVDKREVVVTNWEDLITDPGLDKGFQLLTYTWLLAKQGDAASYHAGILSLKKQAAGFITVTVPDEAQGSRSSLISMPELMKMEEILRLILVDIFNQEKPFRQTRDQDRCVYCPYVTLCGR